MLPVLLLGVACIILAIVLPLTVAGVTVPLGTVWNPRLQKFTYCYTGERCSSNVCDIDGSCARFQCETDAPCFPGTSCINGFCGVATSSARTQRAMIAGMPGMGEACSYEKGMCHGDEPHLFCDNADYDDPDSLWNSKVEGVCRTMHAAAQMAISTISPTANKAGEQTQLPEFTVASRRFLTIHLEAIISNFPVSPNTQGRAVTTYGGLAGIGRSSSAPSAWPFNSIDNIFYVQHVSDSSGLFRLRTNNASLTRAHARELGLAPAPGGGFFVGRDGDPGTPEEFQLLGVTIPSTTTELQFSSSGTTTCDAQRDGKYLSACGPSAYRVDSGAGSTAVAMIYRDATNAHAFQSVSDTKFLAVPQGTGIGGRIFGRVFGIGAMVATMAINAPEI